MHDAMVLGFHSMIKLQERFHQEKVGGIWQFVHMVLTDGDDNSSTVSQDELKVLSQELISKIPQEFLKQYFIGVQLDDNQRAKMRELSSRAKAEYLDANDSEVEKIFNKITISLGLKVRRQTAYLVTDEEALTVRNEQVALQLRAERRRYMLLFTIDGSGSMSGNRWG